MEQENQNRTGFSNSRFSNYVNTNTVKNVIFFTGGIVLFIAGVIGYGVILNLRNDPVKKIMAEKGIKKINHSIIIINRKEYTLSLYDDTTFIKDYRAYFGRNAQSQKSRNNDLATPVGDYKICEIDTTYQYDKLFKLNYPNISDISEGLRKGIITQQQYDILKDELNSGGCPRTDTELGNNIGIHGLGRLNFLLKNLPFVYNWTDGSIAISNESIDEIYPLVKKGTKVVIK
jgi:murein L,D-transpeptidase YafK